MLDFMNKENINPECACVESGHETTLAQMRVVLGRCGALLDGLPADAAGEVLDQFAVESVPTFVFLKVRGARVDAWLDVR